MQRRPGQGTFGGRFGGRKSLQSRKSGRFGGTFGSRNSQTEVKLMHVRRLFRRPKLRDRDESLLSGASFGSRMLPPQEGSAAESPFGCRTWFLPKGQKLGSHEPLASQNDQVTIFGHAPAKRSERRRVWDFESHPDIFLRHILLNYVLT